MSADAVAARDGAGVARDVPLALHPQAARRARGRRRRSRSPRTSATATTPGGCTSTTPATGGWDWRRAEAQPDADRSPPRSPEAAPSPRPACRRARGFRSPGAAPCAPAASIGVEAPARRLALWRDATGIHALDARCPHLGADLGQGTRRGRSARVPVPRLGVRRRRRLPRRSEWDGAGRPRPDGPVQERWGLVWMFDRRRTPVFQLPDPPPGRWRIVRPPPQTIAAHPHLVIGNGLTRPTSTRSTAWTRLAEPILDRRPACACRWRCVGARRAGRSAGLLGRRRGEVRFRFTTYGGHLATADVAGAGPLPGAVHGDADPRGQPDAGGALPASRAEDSLRAAVGLYALLHDDARILERLRFRRAFTPADAPAGSRSPRWWTACPEGRDAEGRLPPPQPRRRPRARRDGAAGVRRARRGSPRGPSSCSRSTSGSRRSPPASTPTWPRSRSRRTRPAERTRSPTTPRPGPARRDGRLPPDVLAGRGRRARRRGRGGRRRARLAAASWPTPPPDRLQPRYEADGFPRPRRRLRFDRSLFRGMNYRSVTARPGRARVPVRVRLLLHPRLLRPLPSPAAAPGGGRGDPPLGRPPRAAGGRQSARRPRAGGGAVRGADSARHHVGLPGHARCDARRWTCLDLMARSGCIAALVGFERWTTATSARCASGSTPSAGRTPTPSLASTPRHHGLRLVRVRLRPRRPGLLRADRPVRARPQAVPGQLQRAPAHARARASTTRLEAEGRLLHDAWWTDPAYRYGDATFRPARLSPQALTDGCLRARRAFFRPASIWRRTWNGPHLRSPRRLAVYVGANVMSRRALRDKLGKPLGMVESTSRAVSGTKTPMKD